MCHACVFRLTCGDNIENLKLHRKLKLALRACQVHRTEHYTHMRYHRMLHTRAKAQDKNKANAAALSKDLSCSFYTPTCNQLKWVDVVQDETPETGNIEVHALSLQTRCFFWNYFELSVCTMQRFYRKKNTISCCRTSWPKVQQSRRPRTGIDKSIGYMHKSQ